MRDTAMDSLRRSSARSGAPGHRTRPARAPAARPLAAAVVAGALALAGCASTPTPAAPPVSSSPGTQWTTLQTLIDDPRGPVTWTVDGAAPPIAGETASAIVYTSGGADVTGVLRIPDGEGPRPVVVVVHGAVDPDAYESGRDLVPEQRALLDAGYAVFALDLRGYAGSAPADAAHSVTVDPGFGWPVVLDWNMALDVVNALEALRAGDAASVDPARVGLLGHSLGGLLALDAAVVAPDAMDAVVTMAAAPSQMTDGPGMADATVADPSGIGTPATNPDYWRDVSPRTFFARAQAPLVLIHGAADDVIPPSASEDTAAAWQAAGPPARSVVIDGAGHLFDPHHAEATTAVVRAFDAMLGGGAG